MKTTYLVLICLLAGLTLKAQDEEMRYIFSDNDYRISGFGAPIVQFSAYDGDFAVFNGGGGAVIFNNRFYIGGAGMGMSTEHSFPDVYGKDPDNPLSKPYNNLQVSFGYGGLWLGYNFQPNKPVHFGVSTKVGAGSITLYDSDFEYNDYEYHMDFVGVISPQVEIEMNLTRWFKINFAAGYRYVTGVSSEEYIADSDGTMRKYFDGDEFNAPYGNISFLFGGFGPKKK